MKKNLFRIAVLIGVVAMSVGSVAAKPPQPILSCDQVRTQSCVPYAYTTCIDSMGIVGPCHCAPTGVWICPD